MQKVNEIARQAGAAIMAVYRSGEDAGETSKTDGSPLTVADMAAHRTIVEELVKLSPEIPILSEEAADIPYAERAQWKRFWLVDPLDGTREFIKRNGEFTVNIALIENGAPVLGAVYAPALDVRYYAARGAGAFVRRGGLAAQPIRVKPHAAGETIKVVASRSHSWRNHQSRRQPFAQRHAYRSIARTTRRSSMCQHGQLAQALSGR